MRCTYGNSSRDTLYRTSDKQKHGSPHGASLVVPTTAYPMTETSIEGVWHEQGDACQDRGTAVVPFCVLLLAKIGL